MPEAETAHSIFWMIQKKFKITTKTVKQFLAIYYPLIHDAVNLDVNFQYILDSGESDVSCTLEISLTGSLGCRCSMPGVLPVCARTRSVLSMFGRSGICSISLDLMCTHFQFEVVSDFLQCDGLPMVCIQPDHD